MINPRVSVVMPVFNRENYIKSAIDSILFQTFDDFELIIVDDGSTDNTVSIIKEIKDSRIQLISLNKNSGVATARNVGYKNSKGEFIVIADSDDINLPNKLEKQVDFLTNNSDIDIVGCIYKLFNENGLLHEWPTYEDNEHIKSKMIYYPGVPAASMFRRDKIEKLGLLYHDESYPAAVDYEWFNKMPDSVKFANIPEVLYLYRTHQSQISTELNSVQKKYSGIIRKANLKKLFSYITDNQLLAHELFSNIDSPAGEGKYQSISFHDVCLWVEQLIDKNITVQLYDPVAFKEVVTLRLFHYLKFFIRYNRDVKSAWENYKYKDSINNETIEINRDKLIQLTSNKKVSIFGTLWNSIHILNCLENENINVEFFIDNYYKDNSLIYNIYPVVSEKDGDMSKIDLLILTNLSIHRFVLKDALINKYPNIKVVTIDEFTDKYYK